MIVTLAKTALNAALQTTIHVSPAVIDANASNIENVIMMIALGLLAIVPATALLYLMLALLRLRRPNPLPSALSTGDVIGRRS